MDKDDWCSWGERTITLCQISSKSVVNRYEDERVVEANGTKFKKRVNTDLEVAVENNPVSLIESVCCEESNIIIAKRPKYLKKKSQA